LGSAPGVTIDPRCKFGVPRGIPNGILDSIAVEVGHGDNRGTSSMGVSEFNQLITLLFLLNSVKIYSCPDMAIQQYNPRISCLSMVL